jgi:hypothetical protein
VNTGAGAGAVLNRLAEQLGDGALDELVHDVASQQASAVNNGGVKAQVRYLVEQLGQAGALGVLQAEAGSAHPADPAAVAGPPSGPQTATLPTYLPPDHSGHRPGTRVVDDVDLGTTAIDGVMLRVAKTVWNGGGISVDVYRTDTGECLTSESLDTEPTLADLPGLLADSAVPLPEDLRED